MALCDRRNSRPACCPADRPRPRSSPPMKVSRPDGVGMPLDCLLPGLALQGLTVQAAFAVACRRAIHARSRSSAAAAARSAAPITIRVICQPGMPLLTAA